MMSCMHSDFLYWKRKQITSQHGQDFLKLVHVCATGLKIKLLRETSIASTIISYLDNASVFIGSSYKDSQVWCIKGIHFIVEQN